MHTIREGAYERASNCIAPKASAAEQPGVAGGDPELDLRICGQHQSQQTTLRLLRNSGHLEKRCCPQSHEAHRACIEHAAAKGSHPDLRCGSYNTPLLPQCHSSRCAHHACVGSIKVCACTCIAHGASLQGADCFGSSSLPGSWNADVAARSVLNIIRLASGEMLRAESRWRRGPPSR